MAAGDDPGLSDYRALIVGVYPDLGGATFSIITQGWHSVAIDVDGRVIFKFPKDDAARAALHREAALLNVVRPAVRLPVPELTIHEGPPVFSRHEKLRGSYLLRDVYDQLDEAARARLGTDVGGFYRDLHALDRGLMAAHGATAIEPWLPVPEIRRTALPLLPMKVRDWASRMLDAYAALPPDPHGVTYGFFDGHGWNMAFDAATGTLNGIYDFADSGIGPLHQDFIYANFIAPDLAERIITAYEAQTGRAIDRRRVDILTAAHRLSELAAAADNVDLAPEMVRQVEDWARHARSPSRL